MKYKILLYCTKAKPYLLCEPYMDENKPCRLLRTDIDKTIYNCAKEKAVNGKIITECDFEIEDVYYDLYGDLDWQHDYLPTTDTMSVVTLENASCMNREQIEDQMTNDKCYAIHIKDVHVFNTPREITRYEACWMDHQVNRINKSMGYLDEPSTKAELTYHRRVYLSLSPQEMYRVLNGEQTVIIRKKVLKLKR